MGWRSGQSYSQDLRDRVLAAVDGGMPVREAAVLFKVSVAYIYKARIRRRLTGDAGINPNRGRPPRKLSPAQELALAAHIRSQPGITLAQAQAWLLAEHGIGLSTGAMWNAVRRLLDLMTQVWDEGGNLGGLPKRDDLPLPAKPHDYEENPEAREAWRRDAAAIHQDNALMTSKRLQFSQRLPPAQTCSSSCS